jgi:hypothetical protein
MRTDLDIAAVRASDPRLRAARAAPRATAWPASHLPLHASLIDAMARATAARLPHLDVTD